MNVCRYFNLHDLMFPIITYVMYFYVSTFACHIWIINIAVLSASIASIIIFSQCTTNMIRRYSCGKYSVVIRRLFSFDSIQLVVSIIRLKGKQDCSCLTYMLIHPVV